MVKQSFSSFSNKSLAFSLVVALVLVGIVFSNSAMPQESVVPSAQAPEVEEDNYEYQIQELTDYQRYITQKGGTERPFDNEYWDNKDPGIYVDIVSGEPLFSSTDKYDSGTGWPSFTKPLEDDNIATVPDHKLAVERMEVKSAGADSHLGHVFDDGPREEGGKRYCINSASLRFIHKDDLEAEGYGQYLSLFEE